MSWFAELFGFAESRENVERYITLDGDRMHSSANERSFVCGTLVTPTLGDLQTQADVAAPALVGTPTVREVVADAKAIHADPVNAGALFQVASQFNLLEMVSPDVTPNDGITCYASDHTQGPACAMACAAGTLQRNWFAQTTDVQIDTLADVGDALDNRASTTGAGQWWTMRNGYALLTGNLPDDVPDHHDDLAIGLHRDTEVTLGSVNHTVTQAYCSALPISYSHVEATQVEALARLVLNSAHEATIASAVINAARPGGNRSVFLTLLGGGVFGNPTHWITDAIERAVSHFQHVALDIAIVSYGTPNPAVARLLT